MVDEILIDPGSAQLAQWRAVMDGGATVRLAEGVRDNVRRCRLTVENLLAGEDAIYGVNTGFGKLAQTRVEDDQLQALQRNLIMSHSVGTGDLLDDDTVRLVLVMKAASLAQGHSGVRWLVIERLLEMANLGLFPAVPAKGSVGASGDLAPLAHVAAAMIGLGDIRREGELMPAADALKAAKLEALEFGPKEGLALINGTQVSTALALKGLFAAEDLLRAALVTGAATVDASKGSDTPFDERIHKLRRQLGQQSVAAVYRRLLAGSRIRESHVDCEKVQDPYCLRCQPQVMGACLDQLDHAARVLEREANAVTDNPLVFPDEGEVLSGGNFHAEPVALAADNIALAIAEIGSLSERRQAMLVDASLSGLPAFLVKESGINSGFMMPQVTSAALVSENKSLAHPASVDSIPTSANQEDHVSMATHAARRLTDMAENAFTVIAIEWLAASQAVEFHAPLETSKPLRAAHDALREAVPAFDHDRFFAPEIETAKQLVKQGVLGDLVSEAIGPSYQPA